MAVIFMGILADTLVSRGGYNRIDAENAERGPRASELSREFLGGSSSGGGGGGGGNVLDTAKQLLGFQQQANQPAIQSLQQQVGEVGQSFAGQRQRLESGIQPLKDRYNQILDEMKGRVSTDISREYGRRGIPLSSGMFEQDLTSKLNPLTRDIGLASEQGVRGIQDLIAGLGEGESSAKRNILNAIAQLQAGEPSGAITQALSLLGQQQQGQLAQQEAAQRSQQQAFQERIYGETTLPESQASIRNIASLITERGRTGTGATPIDFASEYANFQKSFTGGLQTQAPQSKNVYPVQQLIDGRTRYSDGSVR